MTTLTVTITTVEPNPALAGPAMADLLRMVASRIDGSRDTWQGGRLQGPSCEGSWGFGPEPGPVVFPPGVSADFDTHMAAVARRKADWIRTVMPPPGSPAELSPEEAAIDESFQDPRA